MLVDGQTLTTTVAADGTWAVLVAGVLADGSHLVAVTATDPAGNTTSTSQNLLIDTSTVVSITSPPLTNDPTLTISGLGSPGDSITVSVAGQTISTTVAVDGTWSVDVPVALADGTTAVSAIATDVVGNIATGTQDLTVDTTLAAVVTSPTIGNDATPTISGTGEPGATVTIEIAGRTLTTTVAADGTWSVDVVSELPNGSRTALVTVVDLAGNTTSFPHVIVIDTEVELTSADPGTVTDSAPTASGTGEPGSMVTVTVAGRTYTTVVAGDGTWSVVVADELADGQYPVTVRIEDALGNIDTATWTLVVDTVAELGTAAPTVITSGDLVGTGEPGASVTVTIAGVTTVVTVASDGTWSVPMPAGLAPGTYAVNVAILDLAGNAAQNTFTITIAAATLPVTGSSPQSLIGAALALVLVGGYLHLTAEVQRRRPVRARG